MDDDVLGIKQKIMDTWPGWFDVYFDDHAETWVIVQHCKDGVDRLFAETTTLDERVIQRIQAADAAVRGQEDALALIDKHNEKLEAEMDKRFSDQMGEVGERLIHAFHKDGLINRPRIFVGDSPLADEPHKP